MPPMERRTHQRRAICRIFGEADSPLSPQDVVRRAKALATGMGLATAYRNIRSLLESGWLAMVQIPGRPPLYERVRPGHHHYFSCRVCEEIFNIDACPGNLEPLLPKGFRLEGHWLVLAGVCGACDRAQRTERRSK